MNVTRNPLRDIPKVKQVTEISRTGTDLILAGIKRAGAASPVGRSANYSECSMHLFGLHRADLFLAVTEPS